MPEHSGDGPLLVLKCVSSMKRSSVPSCDSREMMELVRVGLVLGFPASSTSPLTHSLGRT